MCQTTGPKYFLPPNQLSSGGNFAAPVNYQSSPQATTNVGNLPAPPQPQPAAPIAGSSAPSPASNPMEMMRKMFSGRWGGGMPGPGGRGPISAGMFGN
jgi:hypothetical protein